MNSPQKITSDPPLSVEAAIRRAMEESLDLHDLHRDPVDLPPDTKAEITKAILVVSDDAALSEYLVDYRHSDAVLQSVRGILTGQEGAVDAFKAAFSTNVVEANRNAIERELDDLEAARAGSYEDHVFETWRQQKIDAGAF